MTEKNATYTINRAHGPTLQDFAKKDCCRLFADDRYQPPTPPEIHDLIKLAGWSQNETARIVGASFGSKGSTTIRKWQAPIGKKEHRDIPYSAWRLMLITAGVVKQDKVVGTRPSKITRNEAQEKCT